MLCLFECFWYWLIPNHSVNTFSYPGDKEKEEGWRLVRKGFYWYFVFGFFSVFGLVPLCKY